MKERFQRFMFGRYGQDGLNRFLLVVSLVFYILGLCLGRVRIVGMVFSWLGLGLALLTVLRSFSRNGPKRQVENNLYFRQKRKVTTRIARLRNRTQDMKTHKIFRCPSCRQQLRVPKGKGKLNVTCPHCKTRFQKRT